MILVLVALPAALAAQDSPRPGLITGVEYRTVSFDAGSGTSKVNQLAVPLGASIPLSRRISFDIGTYFVNAQRTDDSGGTATVSGLTDVVIRTAIQLKRDVAVLTLAANIPTGQHSLTLAQDSVARAVATDLIPFQVSNFGTGFNLTTGLAFAAPVGPWAVGLAGSYRYNSSYEPFAGNAITLRPGGEMRFRVGAERLVGQGRFSFGLTFSTFSNDEFGSSARSPGSRIIPQLSWSLPLGNNSLSIYAWDVYRHVAEVDSSVAKENTLSAGAVLAIRMGRRNMLRPQVEFRSAMIGPGGMRSNGTLLGLGLRYQMQVGSRMSITPGARFDTGKAGTAGIGFTGFSGGLTVRTTL